MFAPEKRILVIAAHPDDDILGCGGTLAKMIEMKCEIRVVFLGEGVSARFKPSEFHGTAYTAANSVREESAINSLNYLGIKDIHFGSLYCVRFDTYTFVDIVKNIEEHINEFKPDILLTHSSSEVNIDHKITLDAVETACRPVSSNCPTLIMSFEIVCSGSWVFTPSFVPNVFVDITNYWEKKHRAWSFYVDESRPFPFPRSNVGLETLAKYRGMMGGVKMAEAFQLQRYCVL